MILIDEDVELKLATALESLRDKPDATRCIYFSLMDKPAIAGIKEKIITSAIVTNDCELRESRAHSKFFMKYYLKVSLTCNSSSE